MNLENTVWKQILGLELDLHDLSQIDPIRYQSFKVLLNQSAADFKLAVYCDETVFERDISNPDVGSS